MEWNLPIFWVIVKYINSAAIIYPSASSSVHTQTRYFFQSISSELEVDLDLHSVFFFFCWLFCKLLKPSGGGGEEWAASCSTGCIYRHNKDGLLSLRLWHWEVMNKVFHKKIFMRLFFCCCFSLQGNVQSQWRAETWWVCGRGRWRMTSTWSSTSQSNTRYDASSTHSPAQSNDCLWTCHF